MKEKIELLAPAGNFEKLKVAFHFGADAVYVGLDRFSLRANTGNFTLKQFKEAVKYTHNINKLIYVAMNIYLTPEDTDSFIEYLKEVNEIKPDGIIVSDLGALYLVKQHAPDVAIHISTQANTTNQFAAQFYKDMGAERVVTARELSLKEIRAIKDQTNMDIEAFVHGAMCIAYSGRCIISSYMTTQGLGARAQDDKKRERSANKGDCSHSCRWEFNLKEKTRPDQDYTIAEDENGTYVLSSKDMSMIDHIQDLINAGVNSFKIEGRMKSPLYVASIVRAYRHAIDTTINKTEYNKIAVDKELNIVSHREFSTGFYYHSPKEDAILSEEMVYNRKTRLACLIEDVDKEGKLSIKIYNKMTPDYTYELIGNNMKSINIGKIEIFDKNGEHLEMASHMNENISIKLYDTANNLIIPEILDIIRMDADF